MPDLDEVMMLSGFGQFHTNEADHAKPDKDLTPYLTIDLTGIRTLVDTPQEVDKSRAQWLIPSTLQSRRFKAQETDGQYWMLWADFDNDPQPIEAVQDVVVLLVLGEFDFEIYNSKSATVECPKSRLLIPLDKPLSGAEWVMCQQILNDELEAAGLHADRTSERPAQLCYLPNRGQHYRSLSQRGGEFYDPISDWAAKIAAKRQALAEATQALEDRKKAAQERRTVKESQVWGGSRPGLIETFNDHFAVQEILVQAGYDQRGNQFRHPNSESGSYSASVKDDRVHSLSSADPLYTGGGGVGAHDAFSAFMVLLHNGDRDTALKDAGDNWLKIDGETWNTVLQREHMQAKEAEQTQEAKHGKWPDLADPFAKYVVPAFPVDSLPEPFARLCSELSKQSGFDIGGYAFAILVAASSLVDHRRKMKAGPLRVPTFLWGGLVANSGGGKSPTLNAVTKSVQGINDRMVKASNRELAEWIKASTAATTKEEKAAVGPKPLWRQLVASDTTVEALGQLLQDNPEGLLLAHDELTEFIGRMDAYSGNGAGKDRGVYLRAYDGGSVTINRSTKLPMVIDNFSVGIIAGIQPEKPGELFRKSGGGSDGLYQRFLVYAMQPAGVVDYAADICMFTEMHASTLFDLLHTWREQGTVEYAKLCPEALPLMQDYHQQCRTMAQRTAAKRLAEHLDKYPGFLARMTFALHCLECASNHEYQATVSVETFQRALKIMRVMYHHSVAVYEVLDEQSGDLSRLTRSACEAILSQGWQEVKRGDLTRYATDWRDAEERQAESAIDCLIELGWLKDITPAVTHGKRGRRSSGLFLVNSNTHKRFANYTERIKTDRAARYEAIQAIASARNDAKSAD